MNIIQMTIVVMLVRLSGYRILYIVANGLHMYAKQIMHVGKLSLIHLLINFTVAKKARSLSLIVNTHYML